MKRATLSPLSSRRLRATPHAGISCGAGFTPANHASSPARPKATLRHIATGRTTRHAYFNAFCAFLAPTR